MENNEKYNINVFKVSDRQKEIIKSLIEQSFSVKNLANMYIGALKVLNDESNPDRIHQSAHSLRELVYYMTDHINIATKNKDTHKEQMKQLISQIDELGGIDKDIIAKQWHELHNYFVNLCHHRSKAQIKDFKNNLLKLEYILFALLGPVYETIEELDRLINIENPSKEDMELVKSLLKKQSHYRYFFKKLNHSNWLDLLVENAFFNDPPQKGEYSIEPLYLTKIADKKPKKVTEVINKLSKTTHEGAQVEFMKALNIIPIKNTIQLKKAIKNWIANAQSGFFALSKQVVLYIKKLFKENEITIAFEMINSILAIREKSSDDIQTGISYDMNYDIEGYFYGEIIKDLLPELKHYDPLQSLRILSKKLVVIIIKDLEKTDQTVKADNDLSLNWRRLIEESDYYTYKKDIKNVLVNALREIIIYIGNEQKKIYIEAIDILRENDYLIFRRLELHIIRNFPEMSEKYISEAISNKLYFNELYAILEFYQLLEDCFLNVDQDIQKVYLKWIEEGPDIEKYKKSYENSRGSTPTEEDIKYYVRYWSLKKIVPIKQYLSDEFIGKYNFKEEEIRHIDPFKNLSRIKIGPSSPIKEDNMENMKIQEILDYVKNYQDPKDSLTFSKIGLGRTLSNIVEKRPNEFTEILKEFLKLPELHKYIYFLLRGFDTALKNKKEFEWKPIISLCKTIIVDNKIRETEISEEPIFYKENTLRDIKTSIGWLLSTGLTISKNSIPKSSKADILEILKNLIDDDEPTLEQELKNIKGNWSLRDMALNSIRGIAMNAIIDFGLWNAYNSYDKHTLNDNSKSKLDDDIKTILEKHIDKKSDPSFMIRYIFGFNLNNLIFLDNKWIVEKINSIFPKEDENQEYWEAAWSGYIDGNSVNNITYKILRDSFERVLDYYWDEHFKIKLTGFSTERFANEIMRMYINGMEGLSSENSLVTKFFQKAPDDVRKLGIAYVGQNLSKLNEIDDYDSVVKRLMELWETRLLLFKKSGIENYRKEIVYFLFWFKNSIFEKKWTILKLQEMLDLTGGSIDVFYDVLDTLLDYINEFPLNVINIIEKIIKNQVETDGYLLYNDKYEPLLRILINSENQEVKDKTRELINYLGSMDLHYFRDLLK